MSFCSSNMGGAGKTVQSSASVQLILIFMLVSPCLGSVRLVGGSRGSEGRLEVTYNGQWGTVCDDNFDVNDAKTACRSLGYTGSIPIVRPSAYYGQGSGPIWLDELRCWGNESNVFQCSHNGVGIHNCGHDEDVGVDCRPPTQIRLVGGGRPSAGRVEVNIGGRWGTVCDDAFDTNDARVVCRMLGYSRSTPRVYPTAYYGRGSEPVWLDDLACSGTEANILQCLTPDKVGVENCGHHEDVGVDCLPSLRSDNLVRLVNRSRKSEGRVEVYHGGRWGTVCDDSFGVDDATVVCRMLGYTGAQSPTRRCCSHYGQGSDPIWLDGVECEGHESSIFSCSHNAVGTHDCRHTEDVGVDCRPPSGPTSVSISGPVYHITDGTKPLTLTCTAYDFTASVSFTWRGAYCSRRVTSAEYNSCTFTPRTYTNGNIVTCTANNTEKTDLFASDSYTLRLKYPPTSSPVITGITVGDSLVEGSNLTLTCLISGGTPHVTEVSIVCEGQGRTLTSPTHYTVSGNAVSKSIDINVLRMEDDGMKCNCSGNWTTQPNLYSRQTSVTIRVVTALAPSIASLTLNGEQQSVAVNESGNISVTLTCTASGRPKPSIRVVRVDTGQPLEVDTSHTSGQDENVQQYTLTTSARCQDAAIYRCEANNRVGSDEENVTLFVNCPPNLVDDNSRGNLERPLILNKSLEQRESARASLHLLVYPSPSLLHVAYVGPNITSNDTEHEGEEIDSNSFLFQCQASDVLYDQVCSISVQNEKVLDAGFYRLTVGNVAGDFSFYVKLNVHAVTEKDGDDSSKTSMFIYIGAGAGGGGVLIIVVVVVVVFIRRHMNARPIYDSPALKTQVNNPGYTDLSMTQISPRVQCEEEVYDNAALDSDNPRENPYVNVTAVSDSKGATGGKGRANTVLTEEASGGDAVYENTVLR